MNTRWIIAGVSAVGVAVLTVSSLLGPSSPVAIDPAKTAERGTPACRAEGPANLGFKIKDMHGATVNLADYKGKVLLVNFWATWCGPCKEELPGLIALYDEYKDKGFAVLGISGDDDAETLRSFSSEWKINYPLFVGRDEQELLDAYGPIFGYPISVVVGRDGAVCARHIGPKTKEQFEKEIKALL
jgi:thiol-disulfide isomerase/thioredoxin